MTNARGASWLASLAAAVSVLLAGCSSGGEDPAAVPDEAPPEFAALYPNDGAAEADWTNMTSFQRDLLDDGEVSFADYEAAVFAFAQCVEESGLEFVEEPTYNSGNRKFEYTIITGETMAEAREGDATISACARSHLSSIQAVWNWNNRPTEDELQQADEAWRDCLRDGGDSESDIASIPAWGTSEFDEWIGTHLQEEAMNPSVDIPNWRRCLDEVRRQFPSG